MFYDGVEERVQVFFIKYLVKYGNGVKNYYIWFEFDDIVDEECNYIFKFVFGDCQYVVEFEEVDFFYF